MHALCGSVRVGGGRLPGVQGVEPLSAIVQVVPDGGVAAPVAPPETVIAGLAIGEIVAAAGLDHVIAVAAMDGVVAAAALDVIRAIAADDRVVAVAGIQAHPDLVVRAVDIQDVGVRCVDTVIAVAQEHPLDPLEFDGIAVRIGGRPRLGRGVGDRHVGIAAHVQGKRVAAVVVVGVEGIVLGPRHADDIGSVEDRHMPVAADIDVAIAAFGRSVPQQAVGALAPLDRVAAGTAVEGVIAIHAADDVVAGATSSQVAVAGAHDRVVTRSSGKICGHRTSSQCHWLHHASRVAEGFCPTIRARSLMSV